MLEVFTPVQGRGISLFLNSLFLIRLSDGPVLRLLLSSKMLAELAWLSNLLDRDGRPIPYLPST